MRALISVSNKSGVVDLARNLVQFGVEIISTGGTARYLKEHGIKVVEVSEITSFPEILDGRVKTLHPLIHGAILAKRDSFSHAEELKKFSIHPVDIVVVNLYPFKETVSRTDNMEEIVENIDIGGPTLLRSAAKNFKDVLVLCDPKDYSWLTGKLSNQEKITFEERMRLALKAFRHTACYDVVISEFFARKSRERCFPEVLVTGFEKITDLRYGENPHQKAALYREPFVKASSIVSAKQLHGKELSYNNVCDADSALAIVKEFDMPCAVAVKHTNPCGVACSGDIHEAFEMAYRADPMSIFGGIVAFNREVDESLARRLNEIYLELILAPGYSEEALDILKRKKNLRVLIVDLSKNDGDLEFRKISGGILVQTKDDFDYEKLSVVTKRSPTQNELEDLLFAWKVVKHVKSNAIVLAKNHRTLAIGAGQMNRVWPTEHCVRVAEKEAKGSALASDAFFPFPDALEVAAKAGVSAVIQPGGSIRDDQVIKVADLYNIAMVFTGTRHFKH